MRREPHDLTDREPVGRVYRLAGWPVPVPMTWDVAKARDQAAHAIAVCAGIGSHGVWGGLVKPGVHLPSGTCTFHSRTCAIARAMSGSPLRR
ncbi:MAG TPA: hypothetical protein VGG50_21940 [Streptosporangiaceae bacterium]